MSLSFAIAWVLLGLALCAALYAGVWVDRRARAAEDVDWERFMVDLELWKLTRPGAG